jgi:hypothetical protein
MLLTLFIAVIVFSVLMFSVTQIVIPLYKGVRLFPFFRHHPLKDELEDAEDTLADATEMVELKEQIEEVNRRKANLEKK